MELAEDVIPPGVLNVITGDGVPVGEALVKHPEVRLVSLTGRRRDRARRSRGRPPTT